MNVLNAPLDQSRIPLLLLLSIGLLSAPHALHLPVPLFAFFSLLVAWRLLAQWRKSLLPGRGVLFLCTLTGIALLISQSTGVLGRDAGTSLFVVALGLKLMEMKGERDLYLAVFLAFFVAVTQFLYEQAIFMSVYILSVTCLLLTVLISVNSRNAPLRTSLRTAAVLVLQALPVMIVLFVLFPRVEAPRWLLLDEEKTVRTGLSDILEPGAISRLGLSPEIAFRAKFQGEIPPPRERYWRGPVFSHTDGIHWTIVEAGAPPEGASRPKFFGRSYRYTLTQEPQDKNWVFALDLPTSFSRELFMTADFRLLSQKPLTERTAFRLTSNTGYDTGPLTAKERRLALQLPSPPSPRIRELSAVLQGPTAAATVERTLAHFRDNRFVYTLMPPAMPDNPIETFLFETRRGFCGHYATAFVYLMRVAGIPARVVGGYQGGEYNPVGKFLEVRHANAHAWAEVWLEQRGWVRVDPTAAIAPERVEQDVNLDLQLATGEANFKTVELSGLHKLFKQMGYAVDSVDYAWQRWVLNYTSSSQSRLLALLGIDGIRETALWLAAGIGLATGLAALFTFRRKEARIDRAVRSYRRFRTKLRQIGLEGGAGEGPLDFGRRCTAARPDIADDIRTVTDLYLKIRYGRSHEAADVTALAAAVRRFRP